MFFLCLGNHKHLLTVVSQLCGTERMHSLLTGTLGHEKKVVDWYTVCIMVI